MSSLCISSRDLKREHSNKKQSQQGTKEAVKIYRHECHLPEVQTVLGWFYHQLNGFHQEFDKDERSCKTSRNQIRAKKEISERQYFIQLKLEFSYH